MKRILVCIDGTNLSKEVCNYGMFISKNLNIPLILLNVIEHSYSPKDIDLSGNIGLGSKEDILDKLVSEERSESKKLIMRGKTILKEMEEYLTSQNFTNYTTLQKHGTIYETLDDLSENLKIAIIGLNRERNNNQKIDSNIEELIRTVNIPILLINNKFKPIDSILMAYDGSDYSNKAIRTEVKEPIFSNITRHIVNINNNKEISHKLLKEVDINFSNINIDVITQSLSGDNVETLLKYQEKNNLDIIVMGAYSHNRFKSAIFGSFTTNILLNSKVPLLLFR